MVTPRVTRLVLCQRCGFSVPLEVEMPKKVKRAYSREFKMKKNGRVVITVGAPPALAQTFRAKCRRLGLSQRALILGWIQTFVLSREEP